MGAQSPRSRVPQLPLDGRAEGTRLEAGTRQKAAPPGGREREQHFSRVGESILGAGGRLSRMRECLLLPKIPGEEEWSIGIEIHVDRLKWAV